ncbi:MAG: dTMP kinase [Candidatus Edwardsbacteria bacterium]
MVAYNRWNHLKIQGEFILSEKKGLFITFEGIEGSGKTTQAKRLFYFLKRQGLSCVFTREPGGGKISEKIRRILLEPQNSQMCALTELFLYEASRAQHVQDIIRPALKTGKIVLCDRFADASLAYQGKGRGLNLNLIKELNQLAMNGLKPDLTFLIDLPAEKGLRRINHKKDRIEREKEKFHQRVRLGYLRLAKQEPERIKVLDGRKRIEELQNEVRKITARCIKIKKKI